MRLMKNNDIPAVDGAVACLSCEYMEGGRVRIIVKSPNVGEHTVCLKNVPYIHSNQTLRFREEVGASFSHLSRKYDVIQTFERPIRQGLKMLMFNTTFTRLLVDSVNCLGKAIRALDHLVLSYIVNIIDSALNNGIPNKRTGGPASETLSWLLMQQRMSVNNSHLGRYLSSSAHMFNKLIQKYGLSLHSFPQLHMESTIIKISGPISFFNNYQFSNELHRSDIRSSPSTKAKEISCS